jgi:hypothetical protein
MRASLADPKSRLHSHFHYRSRGQSHVLISRSYPSQRSLPTLPNTLVFHRRLPALLAMPAIGPRTAYFFVGRMRAYPTRFVKACQGRTEKSAA